MTKQERTEQIQAQAEAYEKATEGFHTLAYFLGYTGMIVGVIMTAMGFLDVGDMGLGLFFSGAFVCLQSYLLVLFARVQRGQSSIILSIMEQVLPQADGDGDTPSDPASNDS
jgi:hypothetical protein